MTRQTKRKSRPNIRTGQVWKTFGKTEQAAFLVGDLRQKVYGNGDVATRAHGVLITGPDGINSHERDMDVRSIRKMFPVLAFDPERETPDEEDK